MVADPATQTGGPEHQLSQKSARGTVRWTGSRDRFPYGDRMTKRLFRWSRRLALLALVGAVMQWIVKDRSSRSRSDVVPTIGGDTWPPVPVKPGVDG